MSEEQKPKRKYTRRKARVEPLAVYAVMVTIRHGRKSETIYGESVRTENGCLVVVSMDGPPPLVEKTRYIPLASAEIEVVRRPAPVAYQFAPQQNSAPNWIPPMPAQHQQTDPYQTAGPRIVAGPLELARQREAAGVVVRRPVSSEMVERNADGIPVVTAGFLDGSPS